MKNEGLISIFIVLSVLSVVVAVFITVDQADVNNNFYPLSVLGLTSFAALSAYTTSKLGGD